jgi:hypothetical protein
MRKYEIHLPLTYNDGKPIEQEKMKRVRAELIAIFWFVPCARSKSQEI